MMSAFLKCKNACSAAEAHLNLLVPFIRREVSGAAIRLKLQMDYR